MPQVRDASPTPCLVLFDLLKRQGHMSHAELAGIVLSSEPLADGRSAVGHASDRTWLSRFVVRCPVASVQPRLFADFGSSAARLLSRLTHRRRRPMAAEEVLSMALSEEARAMDEALAAAGSDPRPYRNYLDRIAAQGARPAAERAELALVLLVAAGCSADAAAAVDYALAFESRAFGGVSPTPAPSVAPSGPDEAEAGGVPRPWLGLLKVVDGYVAGSVRWVDPDGDGCVVGSLVTGEADVCDVGADVSSRHLRVWAEDGRWWASDLGSTNGTWLHAADGQRRRLEPGVRREVAPSDELLLGASTAFVVVEGLPG